MEDRSVVDLLTTEMSATGFLKAVDLMREELRSPPPSRLSTANSSRTVTATGFVSNTVNRLWSYDRKRKEKVEHYKLLKDREERKKVRDRPSINQLSRELAAKVLPISVRSETETRRKERLRSEQHQSFEHQRQQEQLRECTFQPCLIKRYPRLRPVPGGNSKESGKGEPSENMQKHPGRSRTPGALLYKHKEKREEDGVEVRDVYLYEHSRARTCVSSSPDSLREFETLEALLATPN